MRTTKLFLLTGLSLVISHSARAESKTFKVGKVHCADCVAEVKEKVCALGNFAKCEVKITNEKKQLGQVMLTTNGEEKIDVAKLEKTIVDAGYTFIKK